MKIFQASRSLAALTKQFEAAGLKIDDFINAPDETALQAHIESLRPAAATLTVDCGAISAAAVKPYAEALQKFGATVKASDEKAGATAADIEAALNARASIKAGEQLNKHGLPAALPLTPAADATKPATKGKTLTMAEWKMLGDVDRALFFREGGRLDSDV
jgi:hypothetical protein